MDDRDVNEIRMRLVAMLDGLGNLDALSLAHRAGKLLLAGFDIPLTAGQKTGIKGKFDDLAARIEIGATTLETPTGQVGVPNESITAQFEQAPGRISGYLGELIQRLQQSLQGRPAIEQPDGTYRAPFGEEEAQETANAMAAARAGTIHVVGVLRLRF